MRALVVLPRPQQMRCLVEQLDICTARFRILRVVGHHISSIAAGERNVDRVGVVAHITRNLVQHCHLSGAHFCSRRDQTPPLAREKSIVRLEPAALLQEAVVPASVVGRAVDQQLLALPRCKCTLAVKDCASCSRRCRGGLGCWVVAFLVVERQVTAPVFVVLVHRVEGKNRFFAPFAILYAEVTIVDAVNIADFVADHPGCQVFNGPRSRAASLVQRVDVQQVVASIARQRHVRHNRRTHSDEKRGEGVHSLVTILPSVRRGADVRDVQIGSAPENAFNCCGGRGSGRRRDGRREGRCPRAGL